MSRAFQGVVSIPIRADLVVNIHPMPLDLTKAEARKIAAVVLAYATEGEKPDEAP